jgi:hypothetical protein
LRKSPHARRRLENRGAPAEKTAGASVGGNAGAAMLNDITKSRKFQGGSLLKPKLILRIGFSGHAIARMEIFKNLMSSA